MACWLVGWLGCTRWRYSELERIILVGMERMKMQRKKKKQNKREFSEEWKEEKISWEEEFGVWLMRQNRDGIRKGISREETLTRNR